MNDLKNYLYNVVVVLPREIWADAASYMKQKIDQRRVQRVLREARAKTKLDRKHRYLVRTPNGQPIAVTSTQIRVLKKKGVLPKRISCLSIYESSLEIVKYDHGRSNIQGNGQRVKE